VKNIFNRLRWLMAAVVTIQELQDKLTSLAASAKAIQAAADDEKRPLTDEETQQVEGIFAAFEATELEIKRREKLAAQEARVSTGTRRTEPAPLPQAQGGLPLPANATITGGAPVSASAGTAGFRSVGEYALAVRTAVAGAVDPRLRPLAAAPGSPAQENTGADGGYLVPPDFRTNILAKVMGEDSLLSLTDQQTTGGNSITMPVDETTPWQTSGGIQVYWEGEGHLIGQSKVALQSVTVRATKVSALVPVTDELLEDANSLTAYLNRKVPDKMTYKVNDAIINGDGVGKPIGIMSSPALVTQNKEGAQTADTIVYNNIVKMWSRMYAPLRRRAIWIMNQDLEAQLSTMVAPGNTLPAYMAPGGLVNGQPNGSLMGRPIFFTEAAAALGDLGDILLVDPSQYLALIKAGGPKQDVSIHLWFDYGITAFRYSMRIGGQPWWAAAITRAKSALPLSFAVTLEAR
jgi:HK97 family phage major capsid protein